MFTDTASSLRLIMCCVVCGFAFGVIYDFLRAFRPKKAPLLNFFTDTVFVLSFFVCLFLMGCTAGQGSQRLYALAFCLASSASPEQFLIYCGGNVFALVSLVFFKLLTKSRVRESFLLILAYSSAAYLAMALGRWILSLPFDAGFTELVGFLVSDVLSLLFAVLILWSCRSVDGLIEDQKAYLFRLERERQKEAYGDEE
jgi:hypothetical protein